MVGGVDEMDVGKILIAIYKQSQIDATSCHVTADSTGLLASMRYDIYIYIYNPAAASNLSYIFYWICMLVVQEDGDPYRVNYEYILYTYYFANALDELFFCN